VGLFIDAGFGSRLDHPSDTPRCAGLVDGGWAAVLAVALAVAVAIERSSGDGEGSRPRTSRPPAAERSSFEMARQQSENPGGDPANSSSQAEQAGQVFFPAQATPEQNLRRGGIFIEPPAQQMEAATPTEERASGNCREPASLNGGNTGKAAIA